MTLPVFHDSFGREVWFRPEAVDTARALRTRYGDRLLVTISGGELWLQDTPEARRYLDLEEPDEAPKRKSRKWRGFRREREEG